MSVKAMAWAFEQYCQGDPGLKLTLLALCDHADDNGECWPSQERLQTKAGLSHATINRKLATLVEIGLLQRQKRGRKTTFYRICFESQSETPERRETPELELVPLESQNAPSESHLRDTNHQSKPSIERNASSTRFETQEEMEPVDEPPKAKLFRKGKTALVSLGLSEERSGSVIGRWLKDRYDPEGILAAIEYARQQCAVSPVAYVTQILKGRPDGKASFDDQIRELADQAREYERAAGIGRQT